MALESSKSVSHPNYGMITPYPFKFMTGKGL